MEKTIMIMKITVLRTITVLGVFLAYGQFGNAQTLKYTQLINRGYGYHDIVLPLLLSSNGNYFPIAFPEEMKSLSEQNNFNSQLNQTARAACGMFGWYIKNPYQFDWSSMSSREYYVMAVGDQPRPAAGGWFSSAPSRLAVIHCEDLNDPSRGGVRPTPGDTGQTQPPISTDPSRKQRTFDAVGSAGLVSGGDAWTVCVRGQGTHVRTLYESALVDAIDAATTNALIKGYSNCTFLTEINMGWKPHPDPHIILGYCWAHAFVRCSK
jgi:hypothetical protein